MELKRTKAYMEKRRGEDFLDTYAILVCKGDAEGFVSGNADRDTLFDIASMGKVLVTASLLLQAFSEGIAAPEDTLQKYFPEVPADKADITLRQLLTHTSGIVRTWTPDAVIAGGKKGLCDFFFSRPLAFAPDSSYTYSCYGYILLGFVVEALYKKPLDVLFHEKLGGPLGLTRSGFAIPLDCKNAAVTHYRSKIGHCACADDIVYRMGGVAGNGASFFTANDIQRFTKAILARDARFYTAEWFQKAEHNYTPAFEDGRGLGWLVVNGRYPQTGKLFPAGSFGHCGNTGTSFFMHRESGLYTIVLTNATRFSYIHKDFKTCDYDQVCAMREDIHNAIFEDLKEQGIL